MSSQIQKAPATNPLAAEVISRIPQQGRSKASFQRMVAAARALMVERGDEEFTLLDVSKHGNVSIGSIYLRFESKDNLVRTVIGAALEEIAASEEQMLSDLLAESKNLSEFVLHYVDRYAEVLRSNAPLLRLAMRRAAHDPLIAGPGKQTAERSASQTTDAILRFSGEIGGDATLKANSAYNIIFAALARELSLGSTGESARQYDWDLLKQELGKMCLAYLRADT